MVVNWIDAGRPPGKIPFGGFESFTSVIGGVLGTQGYEEWLSNRAVWVGDADLHGRDLEALVAAWLEQGAGEVKPEFLFRLAQSNGLFADVMDHRDDHQRRSVFGRRVMLAAINRPVGNWRIQDRGSGSSRRYRLVPLAEGGA
jgi:hypothetical protein